MEIIETPDDMAAWLNEHGAAAVETVYADMTPHVLAFCPGDEYEPVRMARLGYAPRREPPFGIPFLLWVRALGRTWTLAEFQTLAGVEAYVQTYIEPQFGPEFAERYTFVTSL